MLNADGAVCAEQHTVEEPRHHSYPAHLSQTATAGVRKVCVTTINPHFTDGNHGLDLEMDVSGHAAGEWESQDSKVG